MLTHKGTVTLTTDRLVLRRFEIDDAQAMYDNWTTDEKVTKFMTWDIHESVEKTRELLTQWVSQYENLEYYKWVIEYIPENNIIIGDINLHAVSNQSWRADLGYNIGSKWWNKGIMTEAAYAVVEYAFNEIGMNKICAAHDTENIGSGRVMQKIGMVLEGHFYKDSRRKDGSWRDTDWYGILKENWISNKKAK